MLPGIRLPALVSAAVADMKALSRGSLPSGIVYGGVESNGDPSAYSQVWEWGNIRQTKKGPKTTLGIGPNGERAWLSIQAPFGYVRISAPRFGEAIERRMLEIDPTADDAEQQIKTAILNASEDVASIIRSTVPVDSSDLRNSIRAIGPDDNGLANVDRWSEGSGHATVQE